MSDTDEELDREYNRIETLLRPHLDAIPNLHSLPRPANLPIDEDEADMEESVDRNDGEDEIFSRNPTADDEEREDFRPEESCPYVQMLRSERDSVPIVQKRWLEMPESKLDPLLECAVTVNTQVLGQSNLRPSGAEFVFVGLGHVLPTNLAMVVWCMEQIKKYGNYTGAVVSTNETKLVYNTTVAGKNKPVIGISQEFDRASVDYKCKDLDFPNGEAYPSFIEMCIEDMKTKTHKDYMRVDILDMEWGIIPIEYVKPNGDKVRTLVHVIRVVPAKGFDLLKFLDLRVFGQVNQKHHYANFDAKSVANLLTYAMDHEIDALGNTSLWRDFPHPWTVMNDSSVVSPLNILSPFSVFFKIRRLIGEYKAGTLVIDGFPPLRNQREMLAAINHFRDLNRGYLSAMNAWKENFFEAKKADETPNEGEKTHLISVLTWGGRCLDRLNCGVNIKIKLDNGIYELKAFHDNMQLILPELVKAAITYFTVVEGNPLLDNLNRTSFLDTAVMNHNQKVTPKTIYEKYHSSKEPIKDFPSAGMFSHSWHMHEMTIKELNDTNMPLEAKALATQRYLTVQLTILSRSLLMDLFMSDRVLEQSRFIERLCEDGKLPDKIVEACDFFTMKMSDEMKILEQGLLFDEMQMAEIVNCAAWCNFNEYARMNALNLNGARAIVTSDVLTFLGIHQKTWVWMGYTNIFTGGAGHMRALTEDSHGRVPTVYLIKANSAGYSQVVIQGVNNIQQLNVYIDPSLRDDVLKLFMVQKLDRGTRPALEGLCAIECINGKVVTYPERGGFLCKWLFDEFLRNVNKDGMQAAVVLLPRDSSAGTGCTIKKIEDPDRKQGMVNGKVQQMKGLCPNILAVAGNSHPGDAAIAEASKALLCSWNGNCPGAQPVQESKEQSRPYYQVQTTSGTSAIPEDPDTCRYTAFVLSVVPMIAIQHIALMNKTGLVTFEICKLHKQLINWFLGFFKRMFKDILGSTLLMSYDRLTGIQVARTIASTVNTTVLMHLRRQNTSYNKACIDTLGDCMSSALTIGKCGTVMRECIGKTVCTNLLMINGIIGRILDTPVVSADFLYGVLDTSKDIHVESEDYALLKNFLKVIFEFLN